MPWVLAWYQASGPPQLESPARTKAEWGQNGEKKACGRKLGWEGHGCEVTALLLQVCHGRDEPPRVPCGELVWRTLQTASL